MAKPLSPRDVKVRAGGSTEFVSKPFEVNTYDLPPVLSVKAAAEFLQVDVKTIYEALDQGRFPGRRLNKKRWVILRDKLLEWLWSQECVPSSEDR